jgi:hypothetical protein
MRTRKRRRRRRWHDAFWHDAFCFSNVDNLLIIQRIENTRTNQATTTTNQATTTTKNNNTRTALNIQSNNNQRDHLKAS